MDTAVVKKFKIVHKTPTYVLVNSTRKSIVKTKHNAPNIIAECIRNAMKKNPLWRLTDTIRPYSLLIHKSLLQDYLTSPCEGLEWTCDCLELFLTAEEIQSRNEKLLKIQNFDEDITNAHTFVYNTIVENLTGFAIDNLEMEPNKISLYISDQEIDIQKACIDMCNYAIRTLADDNVELTVANIEEFLHNEESDAFREVMADYIRDYRGPLYD